MKNFLHHRFFSTLFVGVMLFLYGWGIQSIGFKGEEPRRAIVSIEMLETGNIVLPQIHEKPYYNKPPVFNWVVLIAYKLFGVSTFSTRIFSLISLLIICFVQFTISRKYVGKSQAIFGAIALLGSFEIMYYASIFSGEIDLFYSMVVYLQAICIFHFSQKNQFLKMYVLSYLLFAIGFLTKGPPSILFQGLTLLGWLIVSKKFLKLFHYTHLLGALVGMGALVFYFYLYNQQQDFKLLLIRLFSEASQRTAAGSDIIDTVLGALYFPFRLIIIAAPGSLLILWLLNKNSRQNFLSAFKSNALIQFSVVFIVSNMLVYWISGEIRNRYIYMFIPFVLVLCYPFVNKLHRFLPKLSYLFLVLLSVGGIGLFVVWAYKFTVNLKWLAYGLAFVLLIIIGYQGVRKKKWIFNFLFFLAVKIAYVGFLQANPKSTLHDYYANEVKNMLEVSHSNPIYLGGYEYTFDSGVPLDTHVLPKVRWVTPPLVCYHVPYQLYIQNKQLMSFHHPMHPKRYYLVPKDHLGQSDSALYVFHEKWQNTDYCLIKSQ